MRLIKLMVLAIFFICCGTDGKGSAKVDSPSREDGLVQTNENEELKQDTVYLDRFPQLESGIRYLESLYGPICVLERGLGYNNRHSLSSLLTKLQLKKENLNEDLYDTKLDSVSGFVNSQIPRYRKLYVTNYAVGNETQCQLVALVYKSFGNYLFLELRKKDRMPDLSSLSNYYGIAQEFLFEMDENNLILHVVEDTIHYQ